MQKAISLLGIASLLTLQGVTAQVILSPAPLLHVCPNEASVTLSCSQDEINSLAWVAEPYVPRNNPLVFVSGQLPSGSHKVFQQGSFVATLTHIGRNDEEDHHVANLASNMTVTINGVKNGTKVACETYAGRVLSQKSVILYIRGVPYKKNLSVNYYYEEMYFIAVLELGEMFDGGEVPIDHYIIQLDNGTQLETVNSTYSFDIMYNTTLSVKISAHNCAGYSPFFPLDIQYEHNIITATVNDVRPTSYFPLSSSIWPAFNQPTNVPTNRLVLMIAPVATISMMLIIVSTILVILCVCKLCVTRHAGLRSAVPHGVPEVYIEDTSCGFSKQTWKQSKDCMMEENPVYTLAANGPQGKSLMSSADLCQSTASSLHIYKTI